MIGKIRLTPQMSSGSTLSVQADGEVGVTLFESTFDPDAMGIIIAQRPDDCSSVWSSRTYMLTALSVHWYHL